MEGRSGLRPSVRTTLVSLPVTPLVTLMLVTSLALVMTVLGSGPARPAGSTSALAEGTEPAPGPRPVDGRTARRGPATVVAVGDIACAPGQPATRTTCRQADTAALTRRLDPAVVIGLGDLQYEDGALSQYLGSYDDSWGSLRARTLPTPGNHDYRTRDAAGYAAYFDGDPGIDAEPGRPYVRRLAGWRLYLLDSSCEVVSCQAEARWLSRDLRRHRARCTLVAQHHPRWSSGSHGDQPSVDLLWRAAARRGVDVLLAGHDHHYERFAPRGTGGAVSRRGVRSFVVGTGGASLSDLGPRAGASRFRQHTRFGVLRLRLGPRRYGWRFVTTSGRVLDRGRSACH